jgi:hypothetical protein
MYGRIPFWQYSYGFFQLKRVSSRSFIAFAVSNPTMWFFSSTDRCIFNVWMWIKNRVVHSFIHLVSGKSSLLSFGPANKRTFVLGLCVESYKIKDLELLYYKRVVAINRICIGVSEFMDLRLFAWSMGTIQTFQ